MNSFLIMLMFFTRINIEREVDFSQEEMEKGMIKIPIIGLAIGLVLFLSLKGMKLIGIDRQVASIIIFTEYIIISGGLHLDGLSDTLDGIYSNRDRNRMLEIMKDSNLGTFGALGLICVSAMNIILFAKIDEVYIIYFPLVARLLLLLICKLHEYAREDGMGKVFMESVSSKDFLIPMAFVIPSIIYLTGAAGLSALIISSCLTLLWVKSISRRLLGITGDVLGFSIEISQTLFLLMAYVLTNIIKG